MDEKELDSVIQGLGNMNVNVIHSFPMEVTNYGFQTFVHIHDLLFFVTFSCMESDIHYFWNCKTGKKERYEGHVTSCGMERDHFVINETFCVKEFDFDGKLLSHDNWDLPLMSKMSNGINYILYNGKIRTWDGGVIGVYTDFVIGIANEFTAQFNNQKVYIRHLKTNEDVFVTDSFIVKVCNDLFVCMGTDTTIVFDTRDGKRYDLEYKCHDAVKLECGLVLCMETQVVVWTPEHTRLLPIAARNVCHIAQNVIGCEVGDSFQIVSI